MRRSRRGRPSARCITACKWICAPRCSSRSTSTTRWSPPRTGSRACAPSTRSASRTSRDAERGGGRTMAKDAVLVGFIGLGTMGGRMAANLQKAGYRLVVHDLHRQAASHHLNAGAVWAETPRALAAQCDVMFTSLPEPADVEAVAMADDGLLAGIRKGAAWFDLSTNSPSIVKKLNAAFSAKGADMLDAPVSGGPAGAATGKLAIWVGGERAAFDKYKTVLDAMGDKAAYIGPIGAGTN